MPRFNTAFLLKATAVVALCCLPMALMEDDGPRTSVFLIPIALSILVASGIERNGEYELKFRAVSNEVTEIYTTGGAQGLQMKMARIVITGGFLGFVSAWIASSVSGDDVPRNVLAVLSVFAVGVLGLNCCSTRRLVNSGEREFVTQLVLLGKPRKFCLRWKVNGDDYLALSVANPGQRRSQFPWLHSLYVCRGRRRQKIASAMFKTDRPIPGMETSAKRIAKLVELPYEGYRKSKGFWWWST